MLAHLVKCTLNRMWAARFKTPASHGRTMAQHRGSPEKWSNAVVSFALKL